MSGGSMDYLYAKVEDASFDENTPARRAFRKHLRKVSVALRAIEWVDSGDTALGSEEDAISACLEPGAVLAQTIEDANVAAKALREELERANRGGVKP